MIALLAVWFLLLVKRGGFSASPCCALSIHYMQRRNAGMCQNLYEKTIALPVYLPAYCGLW
jgi:hypothetical protein